MEERQRGEGKRKAWDTAQEQSTCLAHKCLKGHSPTLQDPNKEEKGRHESPYNKAGLNLHLRMAILNSIFKNCKQVSFHPTS